MSIYLFIIFYLTCLLGWCFTSNLTIISGHLGDTLTIDCPYRHGGDRWRKKIWCKEDENSQCQHVAHTSSFWRPFEKHTNNSTHIYDNSRAGIVTVNITLLEKELAGIYECQSISVSERKISVLKRVLVKVLINSNLRDVSDLDKVNYSISGFAVTSHIPLTWVIIGSSFLLCKLLMVGLICGWLSNQKDLRVCPEETLTTNAEELTPEDGRDEHIRYEELSVYTDEIHSSTSLYSNYVDMSEHPNKAYWER